MDALLVSFSHEGSNLGKPCSFPDAVCDKRTKKDTTETMQMKETMKDTTETMHLSLITEEATGHWYK